MENQQEIRERVRYRCTPQKKIAEEIGCTNVYFNYWLKGKRQLSEKMMNKVLKFLDQ